MTMFEDLKATADAIKQEAEQRAQVQNSQGYLSLQSQIDNLLEAQKQMLAHIPDSTEEYEMDKAQVLEYLKENNLTEVDGFIVKTRKKNSVDTYKVLQVMGGDIDNLMLVATVTQTALTKFMKDNPGYKELKSCIIEEGITVTDIELLPPTV